MSQFKNITDVDQRIGLLALTESKPFLMVEAAFKEQYNRLLTKMLDPKTDDQNTVILKGVINELNNVGPVKLRDALLTKLESRLAKTPLCTVVYTEKNGK